MGKRRRFALVSLGVFAAWGAWRVLAIREYRRQGGRLVEAATRFPRTYAVGKGRSRRLVVLGDSTAVGVGADRLEETLPYRVAQALGERVTVLNRAVSGAKVRDVVDSQLPFVPLEGADVVLVSVTANDATANTPTFEVRRDLSAILQRLTDLRVGRIVVGTTPNFRTTPALPFVANRILERRAAALADAVRELAQSFPAVRIAELNRLGTLERAQYASDGFHPNADGYRLWAPLFAAAATRGARLHPHFPLRKGARPR